MSDAKNEPQNETGAETPLEAPSEAAQPVVDRRSFVTKALAGVAAGGAIAACGPGGGEGGGPAVAGQRVLWRCASSFPRSLDTLFGASEVMAETVSNLTGGRFQIRIYPAGELVPAFGVMDAVQQGTVQCGHTSSYYYTGKSSILAFDTSVPFGLTPRQQNAWLLVAGGQELIHRVYADFNIINFPTGNTGAQMGGWFKREINTAADMRGLKMRIPGVGGEVMDRLGVAVQNLPGGDIYPALERGAIDATDWVGPYDDEKLGLNDAAEFYYYPGWWEPGPNMTTQVNLDAWNGLSSEYQAAFKAGTEAAAWFMQTTYDGRNPAALQRLIAGGTKLRRFSDDIMNAGREAAYTMYEENAAADATYREIYEHWKAFRDASYQWFGTTELAFAEAQFSPPTSD